MDDRKRDGRKRERSDVRGVAGGARIAMKRDTGAGLATCSVERLGSGCKKREPLIVRLWAVPALSFRIRSRGGVPLLPSSALRSG